MDEITWTIEKRSIKVFEGNKHVKTLSKIYLPIMDEISLNFKQKRISAEEKAAANKLLFPKMQSDYERFLKQNEKYVYELIKESTFIGVRLVKVFKSKERLEAVYLDGGIERAIICDKTFYEVCLTKLPYKHSNY